MAPDARRRLADRQLFGHLETYSRREVVLLALAPVALGLSDPASWSTLSAFAVVFALWTVVLSGWIEKPPPTG